MKKKIKIHIRNNHWKEGFLPCDQEGEKHSTITKEEFEKGLNQYPEIKDKIENITSIIKTKPEIFKAILKSKEKTDDLNEKSYAHPEIYDWNWLECNPDNSTQYIF